MNNDLIAQLEQAGPGLVVRQLRAMARENVLQRLEQQEAAVIAAGIIAQLDERSGALRERLPGLALREGPELLAVRELQEQVVTLTADRVRAQLAYDDRAARAIGEKLEKIEREIHLHESQLRTIKSTRLDIGAKLEHLEAARAVVATLIVT